MNIIEFRRSAAPERPSLVSAFHTERQRMLAAYKVWLASQPDPALVAEELTGTMNALKQLTEMAQQTR